MAIDNTPPRIRLIVTVTVITVVTLVALKFVFDSYFAMMADEAQAEKIAEPVARKKLNELEHKRLTGSPLPIEAAMAKLGKPRNDAELESIEPKPSDDNGPMIGWSKLPKPAPTAYVRPAPTADDPAMLGALVGADGGVHAEAGAPHAAAAGDAGAAHAATHPAPGGAPVAPAHPAPHAPAPPPAPAPNPGH